jgi:hypothetical protein
VADPVSAYIHRSTLVDPDGGWSENVNKVATYVWDTGSLAWVKSTGGGGGTGGSVAVTNFPAVQPVTLPAYATAYDQVSSVLAYLGKAAIGSGQSSSVWQVQQLVFTPSGGVTITWADGDALFNNTWANRASLTYS